MIVENGFDAYHWPPFRAWLLAMDSYGYDRQLVFLNSMHAQRGGLPAPQSRDRMYVVYRRRGDPKPDLQAIQRPSAWCPSCSEIVEAVQQRKHRDRPHGRYRQQYLYRCAKISCRQQVEPGWLPAAAAIDWTIHGQRIGDRTRAMPAAIRSRVFSASGCYWQPQSVEAAGNTCDASRRHPAHDDPNGDYRPTDQLTTLHTTASKAVAVPLANRTQRFTSRAHVAPSIAELRGGGSTARSVEDPMCTVTAAGNHHALIAPYFGASDTAKPIGDALGTLTTRDRYALVMRNNEGGAEMSTPVHEALRTLTTRGHQSLLTPGDLEAARSQVDDCLFRMLEPHEVAAGMAFPDDYLWDGTRRERVQMAGHAITPPAARDLVGAVVEALT